MKDLESHEIDLDGVDEALLLVELYAGTRPLGMGHLHNRQGGLTIDDAVAYVREFGDRRSYRYDYVFGRPIKVSVDRNRQVLGRADLYDRDAGEGQCAAAVDRARRRSA